MTVCKQCQTNFEITDRDRQFYARMEVPEPKRCPRCRLQQRLAHTNVINIYGRTCDLTKKPIISMFRAEAPFPVYATKEWNTDAWDPLKYGRDFDFSRPFFDQYKELLDVVPRPSLHVLASSLTNSEYINCATHDKNSYLIFDSDRDEDCYYGFTIQTSKDVVDGLRVRDSELCYACTDCTKCYNCRYLKDCDNCSESEFLQDCNGCMSCFGCVNLRNAKYCWFNEQLSKEEYEKRRAGVNLGDRNVVRAYEEQFDQHRKTFPRPAFHGFNNVDSTGDYLYNSKNAVDCFDSFGLEDCRYCYAMFMPAKDAYDCFECGDESSLIYQADNSGLGSYNQKFVFASFGSRDVTYSEFIYSCNNIFGCVGLRKQDNCILNKRYSKDEYEALRAKIIDQMKSTGEYGEFFPPQLSAWGYNETMAYLYFPLSKEQAVAGGFKWYDENREWKKQTYTVSENIKEVKDDILDALLADQKTGRNFKIIKQELAFYRKQGIPIPEHAFIERHKARWAMRNPKKLFDRTCDKCHKAIQTTYDPANRDVVYCKECYLAVVV